LKRLCRHLGLVGAVVLAAGVLGPAPAHASPGAAQSVETGGGTISPGLTTTPTFQTMTFSGTAVVTAHINAAAGSADTVTGMVWCYFSGSSTIPETALEQQGSGNYACSGTVAGETPGGPTTSATFQLNCAINYVRVGPIMVTNGGGAITITSAAGSMNLNGTLVGAFVFEPTTINPTTSYSQQGSWIVFAAS
jgi:hypothetical protein